MKSNANFATTFLSHPKAPAKRLLAVCSRKGIMMKNIHWYECGIQQLQTWLQKHYYPDGSVSIFYDYGTHGFRIGEICFQQLNCGESWIRRTTSPDPGAFILACEDFVMGRDTTLPGHNLIDFEEAKERIRQFLQQTPAKN